MKRSIILSLFGLALLVLLVATAVGVALLTNSLETVTRSNPSAPNNILAARADWKSETIGNGHALLVPLYNGAGARAGMFMVYCGYPSSRPAITLNFSFSADVAPAGKDEFMYANIISSPSKKFWLGPAETKKDGQEFEFKLSAFGSEELPSRGITSYPRIIFVLSNLVEADGLTIIGPTESSRKPYFDVRISFTQKHKLAELANLVRFCKSITGTL